jgi:hypothetical protein
MSSKAEYIFSKAAETAITKAQVYLGDTQLVEIFKCAFSQVTPDGSKIEALSLEERKLRRANIESMSRVLQIFSDAPGVGVAITSNPEFFGARTHSQKNLEGRAIVDLASEIRKAALEDIHGFILQAIQMSSKTPLSLSDADQITNFINEFIEG